MLACISHSIAAARRDGLAVSAAEARGRRVTLLIEVGVNDAIAADRVGAICAARVWGGV